MRIQVDDFNTSLYSNEQFSKTKKETKKSCKNHLNSEQKVILNKVENNYSSLNLQSLLHICGGSNYFQMYVLWTQLLIAILQLFSLAFIPHLFTEPSFECYGSDGVSRNCDKVEACSSRYGYKIQSGFSGFPVVFGMECDSSGQIGSTLGSLALGLAIGVGFVYMVMNKLGRSRSFLFSSVIQMWGNIIMCLSVNYSLSVFGLMLALAGLVIWSVNSIVYLHEIFLGNTRRFAVPLVLCIGSIGFLLSSLSTLVFNDYRAVLCVLLVFQILSAMTYFQYTESPFFAYRFQSLGEFYTTLKFILRINFGMGITSKRFKALKSVIFNTDDSLYWVSVLISGEKGSMRQLKSQPKIKPKAHFLDDSGLFATSETTNESNMNLETLSAQCPSDQENNLKHIEEKLFNECELRIEPKTLKVIKNITFQPQTSVKNMFFQTIRNQPLKMLGLASLITYNALGARIAHLTLTQSQILDPVYNDVAFGCAIFLGLLISALIPNMAEPKDLMTLSSVSMLFLFINFLTAEYNFRVSPFAINSLSDAFLSLLVFQTVIFSSIFAFNMSVLFNLAMESFDSLFRSRVLILTAAMILLFVGITLIPVVLNALEGICLLNFLLLGLVPYAVVAYLIPIPVHKGVFN